MDVDTGGAADSDDEYSPTGGGAAAAAAAPRRSRRATAANPMGVTQGGAMRFADLPERANAAIGAQLRLRDIAALEATGPEGQKAAKEMKKDAASATIARANPAPTRHRPSRFAYLHRYINEMPVNPTDANVPPNPPGFGQPGDQPAVSNALSGAVFPQPYASGDTTRPGAVNTLLGHYPPGGHQPTTHRLDRKTLNFLFQATNDPAAPAGHAGNPYVGQNHLQEQVYIPDGTYPGAQRYYDIPTRMAHIRRSATLGLTGPADAQGRATPGPPLVNSDIWGEGTFLEAGLGYPGIRPGYVRYRLSDDRDRTAPPPPALGAAGNAIVLEDSDDD